MAHRRLIPKEEKAYFIFYGDDINAVKNELRRNGRGFHKAGIDSIATNNKISKAFAQFIVDMYYVKATEL